MLPGFKRCHSQQSPCEWQLLVLCCAVSVAGYCGSANSSGVHTLIKYSCSIDRITTTWPTPFSTKTVVISSLWSFPTLLYAFSSIYRWYRVTSIPHINDMILYTWFCNLFSNMRSFHVETWGSTWFILTTTQSLTLHYCTLVSDIAAVNEK